MDNEETFIEKFKVSISFPSMSGGSGRGAEIRIFHGYSCLISLRLSMEEFANAISSLAYRPALSVDLNLDLLQRFINDMKEKHPLERIKISNSSTQTQHLTNVVGESSEGIVIFCETHVDTKLDDILDDISVKYPGVNILVRGHVYGS